MNHKPSVMSRPLRYITLANYWNRGRLAATSVRRTLETLNTLTVDYNERRSRFAALGAGETPAVPVVGMLVTGLEECQPLHATLAG